MREKLNIPKTIHYCWFGGKPLPDEYKSYIDSWKKFCPDFKIKEWNENNFIPQINSWGGGVQLLFRRSIRSQTMGIRI